jgi:hypothetical protein
MNLMSYWSALCVFIDQTLPVGVAWAQANDDLLPDTVGLNGQVGEYLDGKWYGGLYGWTWPHGFYNLQFAALSAAQCALLLTNDPTYLDLPRKQQARILALAG